MPAPIDSMKLSPDQSAAVEAILHWFDNDSSQRFVFGGLAGTGKTTIVAYLVDVLSEDTKIAVVAPTGKAAHVLRTKGVNATTLHSLIYVSKWTSKGWRNELRDELVNVDLIIVDESSMLSTKLVRDVESFGLPVLYVGDHGQLEPVGDDPEIMRSCDVRLEKIHRQAEGSPIIQFAHRVRSGYSVSDLAEQSGAVEVTRALKNRHIREADVILCGYRRTRVELNATVRRVRGFVGPDPLVGETMICLANAVISKGKSEGEQVFNGLCGIVRRADRGRREMVVEVDDGRELHIRYHAPQFGAEETADPRTAGKGLTLWDWGYALTAHKSQGSQWPAVAVYDECRPQWDGARWRYTASTRASEKLIWVKP
jgi:exodeoxyribonuclease-5